MSRLIDADALKDKAFGGRKGLVHSSDIDNAPTIDAIPVEWIKERKRWAAIDGDHWAENIISYLLDAWQKEQEARGT